MAVGRNATGDGTPLLGADGPGRWGADGGVLHAVRSYLRRGSAFGNRSSLFFGGLIIVRLDHDPHHRRLIDPSLVAGSEWGWYAGSGQSTRGHGRDQISGGSMPVKTRPCEICGQPIDPERIEVVPET